MFINVFCYERPPLWYADSSDVTPLVMYVHKPLYYGVLFTAECSVMMNVGRSYSVTGINYGVLFCLGVLSRQKVFSTRFYGVLFAVRALDQPFFFCLGV